jgi:hypothetical protein
MLVSDASLRTLGLLVMFLCSLTMSLTNLGNLTISILQEVALVSSSTSEPSSVEPKFWLRFDNVANCRDVESFNAFVEQFLS